MNTPVAVQDIDVTLYLNKWIAVVRGRVIGIGHSAEQAQRIARQTRPKHKMQLFFVDGNGQITDNNQRMIINLEAGWLKNHPLLNKIAGIAQARHIEIYLVGGAVRDLLLKRAAIIDLDFAVPKNGLYVARQVANALDAAFYPLDEERGTGRVVYDIATDFGPQKNYLDFATFRGDTLLEDLTDRDFTINAIALNLADTSQLIDPLDGQQDLAAQQIKMVTDDTFAHDPVRVLRAIRQATQFGFSIEAETQQQLRQTAPQLPQVSPERQRDELLKMLNTPAPGQAIQMMRQLDVLPHILPQVAAMIDVTQSAPHHLDVFDHTTAALDAWGTIQQAHFPAVPEHLQEPVQHYMHTPLAGEMTPQTLMPLALLLHDTGKPLTRTEEQDNDSGYTKVRFLGHEKESAVIAEQIMQQFRFSGQAIGLVKTVVANHMRPLLLSHESKVSRRATYRFFRDTAGGNYHAGVAVLLHSLADHRAIYPPGEGQEETEKLLGVISQLLTAYFEKKEQVIDPPPLLNGRDLIETFNLSTGQLIGTLLGRLKEAQAMGQINTKAEALAFIKADPDFLNNEGRE